MFLVQFVHFDEIRKEKKSATRKKGENAVLIQCSSMNIILLIVHNICPLNVLPFIITLLWPIEIEAII